MIMESILIGGAINTIAKVVKANKINGQAEHMTLRAFERAAEAEDKIRKQHEKTQTSITKLINRKRGIYQTSIPMFLELYRDIQKIHFVEGEGVQELGLSSVSPVVAEEMKEMAGLSKKTLSDSQAFATYIFTGIGGLQKKKAEMNLSAARIQRDLANIMEQQSDHICLALEAVAKRSEHMADVLRNLNALLMKSLKHTGEIVGRNGTDKSKYTLKDREALMVCFNFAKSVKDLLDVPLLDPQGEITQRSLEAIETGEAFLRKMYQTIQS